MCPESAAEPEDHGRQGVQGRSTGCWALEGRIVVKIDQSLADVTPETRQGYPKVFLITDDLTILEHSFVAIRLDGEKESRGILVRRRTVA